MLVKKFALLFASCLSFIVLNAQKPTIESQIESAVKKIEPKCIAWRRDFHEHPELSNRETRTAKIIADNLRSLGIEVKENVAKTGVVGILRGGKKGRLLVCGPIWMDCQ